MAERYSKIAVALHWLIAGGILFNLGAMLLVDDDGRSRAFIELHKSIGITVLLLVVVRILWRTGHRPPPLANALKPWERKLATATHHALYLLMVLVPLSGWLMNSASLNKATGQPYGVSLFGLPWFNLPPFTTMDPATQKYWHHMFGIGHSEVFKLLLWVALILHVAGALKHQFLDRQPQLRRMWF